MPTLFIVNGYRFFFFSNDFREPKHIHVEKAEKYAKFWIEPIDLAANYEFNSSELKVIERIIEKNKNKIVRAWDEYFSND